MLRNINFSNAMLRWSAHAFAASHISYLLFFVDIRSAFYSMIRELVLPMGTQEEHIDSVIAKVGVPVMFLAPLKRLLQEPSILEKDVQDPHLLQVLTSGHKDNGDGQIIKKNTQHKFPSSKNLLPMDPRE